jgi:hypothetical protein
MCFKHVYASFHIFKLNDRNEMIYGLRREKLDFATEVQTAFVLS